MDWQAIDFVFLEVVPMDVFEDFRAFAAICKGRKKADNVTAWFGCQDRHKVESASEEGILDIFCTRQVLN